MSVSARQAFEDQQGISIDDELAAEGVDISEFFLDVVRDNSLDIDIVDSITSGTVERTMDGASTLQVTVHDPRRILLRSGIFDKAIDVLLDKQWWRLASTEKQGDDLVLTFEDRIVAYLRVHRKPRSASRNAVTRAQFARMLVREVTATNIQFYSPELNKKQEIAKGTKSKKSKKKASSKSREKGIPDGADLKVHGSKITNEQIAEANTLLNAAGDVPGSHPKATKAMICAAIGESDLGANPNTFKATPSHPYWGVLQGQSGIPPTAPNYPDPHDTYDQGKHFMIGGKGYTSAINLAKQSGLSVGAIASLAEGSDKGASHYDPFAAEAQAIVDAFQDGGGSSSSRSSEDSYTKSYQFHRGQPDGPKGENTWDCTGRLAEDVQWRRFVSGTTFYFVADRDLMASKPVAIIHEDLEYIDFIDFDIDSGKPVNEATVTCRADRWSAPAGSTVRVERSGPADGKWLVWTISRGLFATDATITLRQPQAAKKEPAPEPGTRSSSTKDVNDSGFDKVKIEPGAMNPARPPLQKPLKAFLAEMTKHTNEQIDIGTGTAHDQYVHNTHRQSDHWTGQAADLLVGGNINGNPAAASKGDNIAAAALAIFGVPYNQGITIARNGLLDFNSFQSNHTWNGHKVQIGWRCADHYDHVHIGVR